MLFCKLQGRGIIKWSGWMKGIRGLLKNLIWDADKCHAGDRWGVLVMLEIVI